MYKHLFKAMGILCLGAIGALVFSVFVFPYILTSPYFENFQFVKDFKQGKIVVNQKEVVYIQENTALEDAILRVKNSIVTVQNLQVPGGATTASGFIATSDGNIITLASAVLQNSNLKVFFGGIPIDSKIKTINKKDNLALLEINQNNLQTVGFANVNKIKLGQRVFLTYPASIQQDNWLANEGIITEINLDVIKTNITEKSAVVGSPLFNSAGELVGVAFLGLEGKVFAIPISKIQELLGL